MVFMLFAIYLFYRLEYINEEHLYQIQGGQMFGTIAKNIGRFGQRNMFLPLVNLATGNVMNLWGNVDDIYPYYSLLSGTKSDYYASRDYHYQQVRSNFNNNKPTQDFQWSNI